MKIIYRQATILVKKIYRWATTQNGKVERSHRKDQERFYYKRVFVNLEDLKEKGKRWLIEYNNFPMRPLKWMSPKEKLLEYMAK